MQGRADQTLDTIWRRRFNAEITASLVEGLSHMVQTMRADEDLVPSQMPSASPSATVASQSKLWRICARWYLMSPSVPVVMVPDLGLQVELLCQICHDPGWHLTRVLRENALHTGNTSRARQSPGVSVQTYCPAACCSCGSIVQCSINSSGYHSRFINPLSLS